MPPLLEIKDLWIEFQRPDGVVHAVNGVDLSIQSGESLGIVGESGSGKSVTMLSLVGLIPANGRIVRGEAYLNGRNLFRLARHQLLDIRGKEIGMVFQDPMTSLNPIMRIGDQITEAMLVHKLASKAEAKTRAIELLRRVGIAQPEQRFFDYPYQFSGGMRQRVMIAVALACGPKLLIADEPTTALDVTVQAQVLELLRRLRQEMQMGLVLITHDLGVAANYCDRLAVMYAGKIVEIAPTARFVTEAAHPYSRGLLDSTLEIGHGKRPINPIPGQSPNARLLPPGCPFAPRCQQVTVDCQTVPPVLRPFGSGHLVACHRAEEVLAHASVGPTTGTRDRHE